MIESKFVVSWDEELGGRRGALTAKEYKRMWSKKKIVYVNLDDDHTRVYICQNSSSYTF